MVESGSQRVKRLNPFEHESGNFWDEPLDIYRGGIMNINTYENMIGFTAGDDIAGTVDIQINEPFEAKQLTISFMGVERSHLDATQTLEPLDYQRESKTVVEMTSVLADFEKTKQLAPGQYTFYFLVRLPQWLPESTILKTETCKYFMEYTLRAQFKPKNPNDYVFDEKLPKRYEGVSLFRGSRKVYIYQPHQFAPKVQLNFQIKTKVGGFFGFGNVEVTTQCLLEQNQFYPGERVKIKILCDNKNSKSAVRNFKFKLYRTIRAKDSCLGTLDTTETKICQTKVEGCGAGVRFEKEYFFDIPMTLEDKSKDQDRLSKRSSVVNNDSLKFGKKTTSRVVHTDYDEDEKPQTNLCGSWLGAIFAVEYTLRVFVKHDNWLKHGEGEYISLPIRIINTPYLGASNEPFRVPEVWNPIQGNYEQEIVSMKGDAKSDYYNTVYRPRWDKWNGKVTELEKKLEDELFKALEKEKETTKKTEEAKVPLKQPQPGAPPKKQALQQVKEEDEDAHEEPA